MAFDTSIELDRLLDRLQQSHRDALDVGTVLDVGHQHRELVAASTRNDVLRPQQPAEPLRDFAQHMVALFVAEAVVDFLEAIQVDREHRTGGIAQRAGGERRIATQCQQAPVRQSGEVIVMRVMQRLLLAVTQAVDIGEDQHVLAVADGARSQLAPHRLDRLPTCAAQQLHFARSRVIVVAAAIGRLHHGRPVRRVNEIAAHRDGIDLCGIDAQQLQECLIAARHPVVLDHRDRLPSGRKHRALDA